MSHVNYVSADQPTASNSSLCLLKQISVKAIYRRCSLCALKRVLQKILHLYSF